MEWWACRLWILISSEKCDNPLPFIDAAGCGEVTNDDSRDTPTPRRGGWISLFESGDATFVRGTPEDFKRAETGLRFET